MQKCNNCGKEIDLDQAMVLSLMEEISHKPFPKSRSSKISYIEKRYEYGKPYCEECLAIETTPGYDRALQKQGIIFLTMEERQLNIVEKFKNTAQGDYCFYNRNKKKEEEKKKEDNDDELAKFLEDDETKRKPKKREPDHRCACCGFPMTTVPLNYVPSNLDEAHELKKYESSELCEQCSILIAHAGWGNDPLQEEVLWALNRTEVEFGKCQGCKEPIYDDDCFLDLRYKNDKNIKKYPCAKFAGLKFCPDCAEEMKKANFVFYEPKTEEDLLLERQQALLDDIESREYLDKDFCLGCDRDMRNYRSYAKLALKQPNGSPFWDYVNHKVCDFCLLDMMDLGIWIFDPNHRADYARRRRENQQNNQQQHENSHEHQSNGFDRSIGARDKYKKTGSYNR